MDGEPRPGLHSWEMEPQRAGGRSSTRAAGRGGSSCHRWVCGGAELHPDPHTGSGERSAQGGGSKHPIPQNQIHSCVLKRRRPGERWETPRRPRLDQARVMFPPPQALSLHSWTSPERRADWGSSSPNSRPKQTPESVCSVIPGDQLQPDTSPPGSPRQIPLCWKRRWRRRRWRWRNHRRVPRYTLQPQTGPDPGRCRAAGTRTSARRAGGAGGAGGTVRSTRRQRNRRKNVTPRQCVTRRVT